MDRFFKNSFKKIMVASIIIQAIIIIQQLVKIVSYHKFLSF